MRELLAFTTKDRQGSSAATSPQFGKYSGTPPEYWLNLRPMHYVTAVREEQSDARMLVRLLVA